MLLTVLALYLIGWSRQPDGVAFMKMYGIMWTACIFMIVRMMNQLCPRIWECVAILAVTVLLLRESLLGYAQALGFRTAGNLTYLCTGTFLNPGPYGGFLAVCCCILVGYAVLGEKGWIRYICLAAALFGLPLIPATMSRAGMLALACGLLCLAASSEKQAEWIRRHWLVLSCIGILLLGTGYLVKKGSADSRMLIARISARTILHEGLTGAGPGHFCGAYAEEQARFFSQKERPERLKQMADCPEYAFNEYLQTGVEAGPLAMVLTIVIILQAIFLLYRRHSFWTYGLVALSVFALFSYPFSQYQFIPLGGLLIGQAEGSAGKRTSILPFIAAILLSGAVLGMTPEYRNRMLAEKSWKNNERWYSMEMYDQVAECYDGIASLMDHNAEFLFQYGVALRNTGNYAKSDSVLHIGTGISSDPMFWNLLGRNKQETGNHEEAEELYHHAFQIAPNRLYPLFLLTRLYYERNDSAMFMETADKALHFRPKVESERTAALCREIESMIMNYTYERKQ